MKEKPIQGFTKDTKETLSGKNLRTTIQSEEKKTSRLLQDGVKVYRMMEKCYPDRVEKKFRGIIFL